MKTKIELLEIAKSTANKNGFDGVEPTGVKWKEYHVFEMYFEPDKNGNYPCIGMPQFLLLDDDGKGYGEMLSMEETFEILQMIPE